MAMAAATKAGGVIQIDGDFFQTFNLLQERVLGLGGSGEVVLASSASDPQCKRAVKKISLKAEDLHQRKITREKAITLFSREIEILRKLDHPNIIGGVDGVICPDYLAMAMDFCPHGTLVAHLKKMTSGLVNRYFSGLVSAVAYLHRLRIVHGDIKLQNIFVNAKNQPVLGDFGFSYALPENRYVNSAGATMGYFSPEVLKKRSKVDPFKCDNYAVGVVLRCLVLRRRPGYTPDYLEELRQSPQVCDKFRYFLHGLLCEEPSKRATMAQVQRTLTEFTLENYAQELSKKRPYQEDVDKKSSPLSPPRKKRDRKLSF